MSQWQKNLPAIQEMLEPGDRSLDQKDPLEKETERGSWRAAVHRVAESDTTEACMHTTVKRASQVATVRGSRRV